MAKHAVPVGLGAHELERVVALLDEGLHVLVRAAEDGVVPAIAADRRVAAVLDVGA
jgi:hypothetical protein